MPDIIIDKERLARRFMNYVKIDTQSDPQSKSHPSTEKQKNLSLLLVQELKEMGIENAEMDEYGYVYATIASNDDKQNIPVTCCLRSPFMCRQAF